MTFANDFSVKMTHPSLTRSQVFLTTVLSLMVGFFFWFVKNPFHLGFPLSAFVSAAFHFSIFLFFNKIFPARPFVFIFLSVFNLILLGVSVHFTGGILSPFNFFFFAIIVSEASNGIEYPFGLVTSLVVYLTVVGGELTGIIPSIPISTQAIYGNFPTCLWIIGTTILFMLVTAQMYKTVMNSLRVHLEKEQERKQSIQKKLSKLEIPSQVGLLVNKIVHDIRGPLGAISGFIKILRKENQLNSQSQEDCDVILSELDRISNLLNQMTKYARPAQRETDPVDPVDVLESVLSVISFLPEVKRIRFKREYSSGSPWRVLASKEELQQVFFNIFKNAVEALKDTPSHPSVLIKIEKEESQVIIRITDNGPGIPKEVLSKLERGDGVSTKSEGVGVGLLISRDIMRSNLGDLKIRSKLGEGTTLETRLILFQNPSKGKKSVPQGVVIQK